MRKSFTVLLSCCAALSFAKPERVEGEILVKFVDGYEVTGIAANMASGARVKQRSAQLNVNRLSAPRGMSTDQAIAWYRSLPFVEFAEPNGKVKAFGDVNDPRSAEQWGLGAISAHSGWDLGQGNGIIIAILDTGVDAAHPDLSNQMVEGYDFVNNDTDPDDDHGHGTHCAGIAAASTNNGVGIAGIGYGCRIMPVKVLNAEGSGTWTQVASGIVHAADSGAKVISMSLGGSGGSSTLQSAINYATSRGVLVVAAAGNESSESPSYPAYYESVIAVASVDVTKQKSSFSNFGSWVDVAAPGGSILSTYPDARYAYMSGTSMATPHVAGLAGLVWAKVGTDASPSFVRSRIESNCDPVGDFVTHGLINVENSLLETEAPPTEEFMNALSMEFAYGGALSGDLESITASDDSKLTLVSSPKGRSFALEGVMILPKLVDLNFSKNELKIESSTSGKGSTTYALYNFVKRKWENVGSLSARATDVAKTFKLKSNLTPYINGSGQMHLRFTSSNRKAYEMNIDRVTIHRHN